LSYTELWKTMKQRGRDSQRGA